MGLNRWKGRFTSSSFYIFGVSIVNGDIEILLPESITKYVNTIAKLTHTGLYKNRTVLNMLVDVQFDETKGGIINNIFNDLVLEAKIENSIQTIQFRITKFNDDKIEGEYDSFDPGDNGTFVLNKINEND